MFEPHSSRFRRAIWLGAQCAAVLALTFLIGAAAVIVTEYEAWPAELLHHFVPQYAVLALCVAAGFVLAGRQMFAGLSFGLAALFATIYVTAPEPLGLPPSLLPAQASTPDMGGAPHDGPTLSLISHNILQRAQEPHHRAFKAMENGADVVVLQEVDSRLGKRVADVRDEFPYSLVVGRAAPDVPAKMARTEGLVVFSRYPILDHRVSAPADGRKAILLFRIDVPNAADPWIAVVHPRTPMHPHHQDMRDRYLGKLAELVRDLDGPVIVAGDFNATPFAPAFRRFVRDANLTTYDSFPSTFPAMLGPVGIPIDHVLVRGAALEDFDVLPPTGSDHLPIKAVIRLPREHITPSI